MHVDRFVCESNSQEVLEPVSTSLKSERATISLRTALKAGTILE